MRTINFKKLNVEVAIDQFDEMDVTKDVGNFLFQAAPNLEIDNLARTIHASTDSVEIEDSLYEQMMQMFEGNVAFRVVQAIKNAAQTVENK